MSAKRRRTLAEAHLALEALISDIATLVEVVADDDMPDAYDDYTLESMFTKQVGERFATQLVYRLLHDDEVLLEWLGEVGPDRLLGMRDDDEEEGTAPTVADALEYARQEKVEQAIAAHTFRQGDEVQRVGRKPRGKIFGRDALDPNRLQVRWDADGRTEWWRADELRRARPKLNPGPGYVEAQATAYPADEADPVPDDEPTQEPTR